MESDQLDATVAAAAGIAAGTVRNLRTELGKKGLVRSIPLKDDEGEIQRWYVALTNAATAGPRAPARGNATSRDVDYLSQKRAEVVNHITTSRLPANPLSGLPDDAPEWERAWWAKRGTTS